MPSKLGRNGQSSIYFVAFAIALTLKVFSASSTYAATFDIPVNPKATYLTPPINDLLALDTIPITLSDFGINEGDFIKLQQLGDFSVVSDPAKDFSRQGITGLFSSSNSLLSRDFLFRVPGAIDTGIDVITTSSNPQDSNNEIPEDFFISAFLPLTIQVPQDTNHLFVAARDQFWGDNGDADGDFVLNIETMNMDIRKSVSEPSILFGALMLGVSILGTKFLRRTIY